ncbi:lytic murein transglycosylase B [Candidatus Methylospira mobilis]|nr:lytic murein transglycosylase B [Candidatus Methylospira mobilis]WNV05283.1 lytic murein transglycosylase B [Candidatus Methylospira mobilis]
MKIAGFFHLLLLLVVACLSPGVYAGEGIAERPDVRAFIQSMANRFNFDESDLNQLFNQVVIQDKVLELISKPAESKPWYAYRKLLLTDERVQEGVAFREKYAQDLEKAEMRYGVAPEIIVAIIGVETRYGQKMGNYRVMDALATLSFEYPRRAEFFRKELQSYLLLCRDEGVNPIEPIGSYAGAMGIPQFMPSSYRRYAVDLDGDTHRDIWKSPADAIGSVAHYFAQNGWSAGEPVAFSATTSGTGYARLLDKSLRPAHTLEQLSRAGVDIDARLSGNTRAHLLSLEGESGSEYWVTFNNFHTITRYNHSPLYAMLVYQLADAIKSQNNTKR